ncbi:unnamed protein product [Lymnaea stagnalis]|uniref:Ig-like domain-containing protein n=1 Tax=Lymnaea stagnalis TaxID=6523 RepID=A0AAV2IKZ6_LYMST
MHFGESGICDVMQFMRVLLTVGLFIAAQGQGQLFDKYEIEDGGRFNLTCDASRIGGIPAAVTEISELSIERVWVGYNPNHTLISMIATYRILPEEEAIQTIVPTDRGWLIEESGNNYPTGLNNRATMKIVLYVPYTYCFDAGSYTCKARFNQTGGVSEASRSETIIYKERINIPVITLDPHNGYAPDVSSNMVGEEVKLTCQIQGLVSLAGLELTWLTGPRGGNNFVPYPTDGAETVTPGPPDRPCERGKYESTLTFKVPAVDTTYTCVAKDGDNGASRTNFTIVHTASIGNKGANLVVLDSQWFVRNMLMMVVAFLKWSGFV